MMNNAGLYNSFLKIFPLEMRQCLQEMAFKYEYLQEVRLRVNRPLCVQYDGREWFLQEKGGGATKEIGQARIVREREIKEVMQLLSGSSLYAYEEELRQGYLTIQGGHRVGVTGKLIVEGGLVKGIKYISGMNIRLAHQVLDCARPLLPKLVEKGRVCSTLIISPPRCGKTTLLRDIVRLASDGTAFFQGCNVGVVDERSELGGCYLGIPQNDLGIRTDILDGCPKSEGLMMLIRSMAPQIVAVDEIGSEKDARALEMVQNCGCRILATVHAEHERELYSKPVLKALLERKMFRRFVFLAPGTCGKVEKVLDEQGRTI